MIGKHFILALALVGSAAFAQDVPPAGELRITGASDMAPLLAAWSEGFERANPDARIVANLKGRASAIYGLEVRTADLALMDRGLNPFERYGTYERSWTYPVEIEIGTAGGYAVFVHPKNPLRQLTLAQLDGIFGAQRDGGWDRLVWNKAAARGADRNLRRWGKLGMIGALGSQAIHVYGPPLQGQGSVTDFQRMVLQGGAMWNEDYREFADPAAMFAALARDPAGIAYIEIGSAPSGWKPLALATERGSPFMTPTSATLADRSYPLARPAYLYFTIDSPSGHPAPVKPLVRAFANYVLSADGQAMLERAGRYYRLPAAIAERQRAVVASDGWPKERPRP